MNTKEKGILKRAMVSRYHTKSHHCNTTEIDVRNASDYYYIIIIMNTKEKGILKRAMVSRYHTKSHHCNTTEIHYLIFTRVVFMWVPRYHCSYFVNLCVYHNLVFHKR